MTERPDKARGILDPQEFKRYIDLKRYLPSPALSAYVEHYWLVRWDLPAGRSYSSENLPYPSVHLVFEPDHAYLQGVTTNRFTHRAVGKARVFSAKFLPGMFYPFVGRAVKLLTDTRVDLRSLFGEETAGLSRFVQRSEDVGECVVRLERFLTDRLDRGIGTTVLDSCKRARQIVGYIAAHREVTSVRTVEEEFAIRPRTLQVLFARYVGVGAKWVIRRFRIHDAVETLHRTATEDDALLPWTRSEGGVDLSALALDLGYSDQSHFTNDFRAMTGRTPAEYSRANRTPGGREPDKV